MKRYFLEMGVDPGIVEASSRTSPDDIHFLNREEMARFGIETVGPFETRWLALQDSLGRGWVFKAWTQSETPQGIDYRTTLVRLSCDASGDLTGNGAEFSVRRELRKDTGDDLVAIEVTAGETKLRLRGVRGEIGTATSYAKTSLSLLDQVAAGIPTIEINEMMPQQSGETGRVIKLSTIGLLDGLRELRAHCLSSVEQMLRTLPSTWR
jgi:hypothetical protein